MSSKVQGISGQAAKITIFQLADYYSTNLSAMDPKLLTWILRQKYRKIVADFKQGIPEIITHNSNPRTKNYNQEFQIARHVEKHGRQSSCKNNAASFRTNLQQSISNTTSDAINFGNINRKLYKRKNFFFKKMGICILKYLLSVGRTTLITSPMQLRAHLIWVGSYWLFVVILGQKGE